MVKALERDTCRSALLNMYCGKEDDFSTSLPFTGIPPPSTLTQMPHLDGQFATHLLAAMSDCGVPSVTLLAPGQPFGNFPSSSQRRPILGRSSLFSSLHHSLLARLFPFLFFPTHSVYRSFGAGHRITTASLANAMFNLKKKLNALMPGEVRSAMWDRYFVLMSGSQRRFARCLDGRMVWA